MRKQAIIIGSGIAGIATSIRLACQGYDRGGEKRKTTEDA